MFRFAYACSSEAQLQEAALAVPGCGAGNAEGAESGDGHATNSEPETE